MDETNPSPIDISTYKTKIEETPNNYLNNFKLENRNLSEFIHVKVFPDIKVLDRNDCKTNINNLLADFYRLVMADIHYTKKENISTYISKEYGPLKVNEYFITRDDEIRKTLKEVTALISNYSSHRKDGLIKDEIVNKGRAIANEMLDMIAKEMDEAFISAMENIKEEEWTTIDKRLSTFSYLPNVSEEKLKSLIESNLDQADITPLALEDSIIFDTGYLNAKEISSIFNAVPMDICFIDYRDIIKYFSQSNSKTFDKPRSILGKPLLNYQGPISSSILTELFHEFRKGTKDTKEFYLNKDEENIYIKYLAIRDSKSKYLGCLEIIQNITNLNKSKEEENKIS